MEENKDNMNLDESAWFSMGSLLGQGTDNQPKAISGQNIAYFARDSHHKHVQG